MILFAKRRERLRNGAGVGFAIDMFGRGVLGKSKEENAALKKPFLQDRALLKRRVLAGLAAASSLSCVDSTRIGAVGFGFGGICSLDLARSGKDLNCITILPQQGLGFPFGIFSMNFFTKPVA